MATQIPHRSTSFSSREFLLCIVASSILMFSLLYVVLTSLNMQFSNRMFSIDLKRPDMKLALGLHVRSGQIRHIMPAVSFCPILYRLFLSNYIFNHISVGY